MIKYPMFCPLVSKNLLRFFKYISNQPCYVIQEERERKGKERGKESYEFTPQNFHSSWLIVGVSIMV